RDGDRGEDADDRDDDNKLDEGEAALPAQHLVLPVPELRHVLCLRSYRNVVLAAEPHAMPRGSAVVAAGGCTRCAIARAGPAPEFSPPILDTGPAAGQIVPEIRECCGFDVSMGQGRDGATGRKAHARGVGGVAPPACRIAIADQTLRKADGGA